MSAEENYQDDEEAQEDDNYEGEENIDDGEIYEDDNFDNGESQEFILDNDDDDDGDFELTESQQFDPIPIQQLQSIINTYNAYMYNCPASLVNYTTIHLDLPRNFLPLSLQAVYGFLGHENLLEITIELNSRYEWNRKPSFLKVEHPTQKEKYVGSALVQDACEMFFSDNYKPRKHYRSMAYLLTPSGQADSRKVNDLMKQGFEQSRAENALVLCGNNISTATQFLKTGELPNNSMDIEIDYGNCQLLYLVLEIAECFLDLQDHCCICRRELAPGLKPSICDNQLCTFQFTQIGVGTSITQEIQRDPMAADLIFSIFSSAIGTKYFTPRPPNYSDDELRTIAATLNPMSVLAKCADDTELIKLIKPKAFELLRWVLLSNRSHMLHLNSKFRFSQFGTAHQYLSLISTPQAEQEFNKLKQKYSTLYLFHGSSAVNWHSILRNGLKNASGTDMQANGAALGSGIYFARNSNTSQGYAHSSQNKYKESKLGPNLQILALCEISKVPELKDHGWAHTLTREEACIVRFLLVNGNYSADVINDPPVNVPTLKDVLNYHAEMQKK